MNLTLKIISFKNEPEKNRKMNLKNNFFDPE